MLLLVASFGGSCQQLLLSSQISEPYFSSEIPSVSGAVEDALVLLHQALQFVFVGRQVMMMVDDVVVVGCE
jgi:hypothetical protein